MNTKGNGDFEVDKHTLNDLHIFKSENGSKTIFDIYAKTQTSDGALIVKDLLSTPLSCIIKIKERVDLLENFKNESY